MEEGNSSSLSSENEQRIIVKFLLTLDRNKKIRKIHSQLMKVYRDDVIGVEKLQSWIDELKEFIPEPISNKKPLENVYLHTTEDPWRPSAIPDSEAENESLELILRKVLRTLNKITLENFPAHLALLQSLPINTEDCLRKVVKLFLSHISIEHKFSNLYAKLCAHLQSKYVPYEKQIIGACPMYLTFGELVRSGCEEKLKIKLKQTETESFETSFQLRYKLKGLITFMADLFMENVLPLEVIHDEYLGLLLIDDTEPNLFKIELSCVSLLKLGKYLDLESEKTSPKIQKEKIDSYFINMSKLLKGHSIKLPLYLHFMTLGLIELRGRNWIPKIQENNEYVPDRKIKYKNFNHRRNIGGKGRKSETFRSKARPVFILKRNYTELNKAEWQVRGCMNKMSDTNFTPFVERILALPLEQFLPNIVTLIANKSAREPLFSHLYAELCRQLCLTERFNQDNISFKQLLLNECDRIWYETINNNEVIIEDEHWYDYKVLRKGLVKFYTELYKLGVLSVDIVNNYLQSIFTDESKQTIINIEFLCNFLTYVGEYLEKENKESIEKYFINIETLYEKKETFPKRILFMLLDLRELRERKWLPRVPLQIVDELKNKPYFKIYKKKDTTNDNQSKQQLKKNRAAHFSKAPRFMKKTDSKNQNSNVQMKSNTRQVESAENNDLPTVVVADEDIGIVSQNESIINDATNQSKQQKSIPTSSEAPEIKSDIEQSSIEVYDLPCLSGTVLGPTNEANKVKPN